MARSTSPQPPVRWRRSWRVTFKRALLQLLGTGVIGGFVSIAVARHFHPEGVDAAKAVAPAVGAALVFSWWIDHLAARRGALVTAALVSAALGFAFLTPGDGGEFAFAPAPVLFALGVLVALVGQFFAYWVRDSFPPTRRAGTPALAGSAQVDLPREQPVAKGWIHRQIERLPVRRAIVVLSVYLAAVIVYELVVSGLGELSIVTLIPGGPLLIAPAVAIWAAIDARPSLNRVAAGVIGLLIMVVWTALMMIAAWVVGGLTYFLGNPEAFDSELLALALRTAPAQVAVIWPIAVVAAYLIPWSRGPREKS